MTIRSSNRTISTRIAPRGLLATALLTAVFCASGCAVSNQALRADFTDFNNIIQFNQSQQMLLNLVRLHYREPPMFLQAGSLLASYSSVIGGDSSLGFDDGYGLGLDYEFASKPTITYTPIEGKAYVTQFMTEVSFDTLCLLVRAGWPVTKLCDLIVEKIALDPADPLRNDSGSPSFAQFTATVAMLQKAQEDGKLSVVNSNGALEIIAGTETIHANAFQLRSLSDIMFVASKNTETPIAHLGRTKATKPNGVITIHASKGAPSDAMVWVQHGGHYFSIDDTDIASKDTLALLMQLFRIQAAPPAGAPLLTLPVR
jgi:hypothetical protein